MNKINTRAVYWFVYKDIWQAHECRELLCIIHRSSSFPISRLPTLKFLNVLFPKKMTIRQSDALCTICSLLFTLYFYTKYINALFSNVCCVYLLNPLLNVFALFSKCFKIIKGRKKTIFVYLNFCTLFSKMKKKIIGAYLIFGDYLHTSIISWLSLPVCMTDIKGRLFTPFLVMISANMCWPRIHFTSEIMNSAWNSLMTAISALSLLSETLVVE